MSKKVQTELAEANSVAEEALSSMTTVKAHAAEDSTLAAYAGGWAGGWFAKAARQFAGLLVSRVLCCPNVCLLDSLATTYSWV